MSDNRIFNVNGESDAMLLKAIQLCFDLSGCGGCMAWTQTAEHGLILLWSDVVGNPFPSPMSAFAVFPMVQSWLAGDFAKTVTLSRMCENADHDGHNTKGWQVYCEDWGHVGSQHYAICGIKPAWIWYGK